MDLKVNSAEQSAYYQEQSVQMLYQISQQIASVGGQISANFSTPLPYPTFYPTASDRRVNTFWIFGLICSLSAALLATLVQQWSKAYMHIFQQVSNPLRIARIRAYLSEGSKRLPVLAEVVLGLIHISVILFFVGLNDLILQIDRAIFSMILVPTTACILLYLCCILAPMCNPQSPYRTPFSSLIWFLIQKLSRSPRPSHFEKYQEHSSMEETEGCMDRDVRAIQWLVDRSNDRDKMQALVLAIPGSFNGKWGPKVWNWVMWGQSTSPANLQAPSHSGFSSAREGTTVHELCRRVRYFFETYKDEENLMDTAIGHRCLRGYVETAASLVCCTGVELSEFGEVGEVLSEVSDKEKMYDPSKIRSSPSFAVRLTCLSLVAIKKMVDDNKLPLQEVARISLDGIARLQTTGHSYHQDITTLMTIAQKFDDYLTMAWAPVAELHVAIESWSLNRTESESDIRLVLNSKMGSILELERIANEVGSVEDVDSKFSLLLETMDKITHNLIQRLPGVWFDKPEPAGPIMISKVFDFPSVESTVVPPQLNPPGRQIQSLCTLGRKLRDIMEGQNTESQEETLKSLDSLRNIPVSLRGRDCRMKRQLWRLLELRDGGGLGFTIELFFLAVRQLELSSASSPPELKEIFYTGTFNTIKFDWEKSKNSVGTQRVLLDLLCDLIIGNRGAFSNFSYPPYIVDMLLDLVGKMVEGYNHDGSLKHIDDIIRELEEVRFRNPMNKELLHKVLDAICPPPTQTTTLS